MRRLRRQYSEPVTKYNEKDALQLAGKLAQASQLVVRSNAFNLSTLVASMNNALQEYDDYIMAWTQSKETA